MRIGVVTFNENEALAVDSLLSDLASGAPSPWRREGRQVIARDYGTDTWRLEHFSLLAQGNVVAAAALADQFAATKPRLDFVIFYGCAGAVEPLDVGEVFLVQRAHYLSLGKVAPIKKGGGGGEDGELVTLKNKWLCHLQPPADAEPLTPGVFPLCSGSAAVDVPAITGLPTARVAATDKVVTVPVGMPPAVKEPGPPHDLYEKKEWTYGEALAFVAATAGPLLVEMESFGIARVAEALGILDRVVVLRVTTDTLVDHNRLVGSNGEDRQRQLLLQGRAVLGYLLAKLYEPGLLR
jgi:nucleoside phosphorylase